MTDVILVSEEWLTLRAEADARARSTALAEAVADVMLAPVVVHDLGSGTGSMMRWLAPHLPGPQTWVLHDWNPALLERAVDQPAHDAAGGRVAVRTSVEHVALLREHDLAGASLVTTSALLDVLTRDEAEAVVRACVAAGVPALFSLSVSGRVQLEPLNPADRVLEAAFNDHQRRTADGRRLLGPDAVDAVADLFRSAGWLVRIAESPWRLDASDRALVEEWLDGWTAAAVEERPVLNEWAQEYLRLRAAQLANGGVSVVVHHRDLLAYPP